MNNRILLNTNQNGKKMCVNINKEKSEFYIERLHAGNLTGSKSIFGLWNMIKFLYHFLTNGRYISVKITKCNNITLSENQYIDNKGNLITDMRNIKNRDK